LEVTLVAIPYSRVAGGRRLALLGRWWAFTFAVVLELAVIVTNIAVTTCITVTALLLSILPCLLLLLPLLCLIILIV
jgi:hypothetical protein